MPLLTLINLAFLIIGLWLGIAGLVGANRFAYRPLYLLAIGGFLISVSVLLDLLQFPYVSWITRFALIAVLLFNIKYRSAWQQHGITDRQLFFFTNH
jgi:hypothetical protein